MDLVGIRLIGIEERSRLLWLGRCIKEEMWRKGVCSCDLATLRGLRCTSDGLSVIVFNSGVSIDGLIKHTE
jgi:hypothetical protein